MYRVPEEVGFSNGQQDCVWFFAVYSECKLGMRSRITGRFPCEETHFLCEGWVQIGVHVGKKSGL